MSNDHGTQGTLTQEYSVYLFEIYVSTIVYNKNTNGNTLLTSFLPFFVNKQANNWFQDN